MTRFMFFAPRAGLLLMVLGTIVFLTGGCDRFMAFRVHAYVLDARGQPLAGETVGVIPSQNYRWPQPTKEHDAIMSIDMDTYGDVYRTEPNGLITFDVVNKEPVGLLDVLILDTLFPPSVKFLIMLPDRQPSGYAVTFIPGGDYEQDRLTYRHFDLKTGHTLRTKYSDAAGGLDATIHRPPRDPNNPWSTPRPSLDIRILTHEDPSRAPPLLTDNDPTP